MTKNPLSVPVRNRPRSRPYPAVLAVAALFGLSACEETRHEISKALGLEKPDFNESEVLTGEPLAIPPDFELRPPGSGEELYYPSAGSAAPAAATPQAIPVQQQQPYQQPYRGAYPAQPIYGQAVPHAIPPSTAQNVFTQATQAYGHGNTGGYAATPSGAYNYGGYGGQPVYTQPYPQPHSSVYGQQPSAQDLSGYKGQRHTLPPAVNTDVAAPSQECKKVVVDISGNYVCKN